MEKEDLKFDQSLRKLDILFTLSGMNLKHEVKTFSDRIRYSWFFIFNFITLVLILSCACTYVFLGIANNQNIIEVSGLLPCMSITIVAIFKSFSHLFKERKIADLLKTIRNLEKYENQREPSVERTKIVNDDYMFLKRVINILYVTLFSMQFVFNVGPLVMITKKYYESREFEMILQYIDIFAYTPYEMKYWILSYIHQFWAEYVVLVELGASDYLLITCSFHLSTQLRLLQHDIKTLMPESDEDISDNEFQSKFSKLVIRHQNIIASTKVLESIYSSSNLVNFLSSSLVICLTGFTLTVVRDLAIVVKNISFFIMGLAQVFFVCWFGDILTNTSIEVSDAVYHSLWYNCRVSRSKALLMIQTRAQQPCTLTTAGFADINLRAFLRVLSSAWSYFALLQTMVSSDR